MTPYRTAASCPRPERDAEVARFAATVQRGRCQQRAVGLAALAVLSVAALVPLALPVAQVHEHGAPLPAPRRLPVRASVLSPGMCGPERDESEETRFALAVAGLAECPWF